MALPTPAPTGAPSNDNTNGPGSTADKINHMSVVMFQSYLTQRLILLNTNKMVDQLDTLISIFKDKKVQDEQNDESDRLRRPSGSGDPSPGTGIIDAVKYSVLSAAVIAIGAAITALEEDVRKTVEQVIATLALARKQILESIIKFPGAFIKLLTDFNLRIDGTLRSWIRVFEAPVKLLTDLITKIGRAPVISSFVNGFNTIMEILAKIAEVVGKVIGTVLRPVLRIIEGVVGVGLDIIKVLGKTVGKIFLPLQVLLSAIDFIDGFIKGYKEGGIKEGIKQGLVAVFDGLFVAVIELAKNVVTWILDKIGLKNLAKQLGTDIDRLVTDIKNIFSSVIDLFIGIATLDGKKIWAALKTGASSFGEFFLHTITGGINLLVNFVADLFGVKMEGSFDILSSDTVKKLVGVLTDFGNTIVDWVKGLARATIELLPGGEKMANRIFGEREFTEDDVEDKAKDIAIERTKSGMTTSERYGLSRSGGVPKYTITDADRAQALKELAPKGKITPKDVKSLEGDDLLNRIEKLLQTNTNEKGVQINDNRTNTTINGGGRGASTVSVVPRTEKASFSNPIRR